MEANRFDGKPVSRRSLAEKLDHLFRAIHKREMEEFSYEEVASAIRQSEGPTISATYIWQLRKGLRDNPTKKHLEALADFFGVSPAYFFDDEAVERIEAELDLLAAFRDSPVRKIALRAFGLSAEYLEAIAKLVEETRKLAGLPDQPEIVSRAWRSDSSTKEPHEPGGDSDGR